MKKVIKQVLKEELTRADKAETQLGQVGKFVSRVFGLIVSPLEVVGGDRRIVAPLHALAEMESEDQTIGGDGVTFSHVRNVVECVWIEPQQPAGVDHTLITAGGCIGGEIGVEANGIGCGYVMILSTELVAGSGDIFGAVNGFTWFGRLSLGRV